MYKFFRNIFILITSFILLSAISIISVLWTYSNDLPDYKFLKSYKPPVSSKVYSGNGDLVADFSQEKRVFVPFNSIPKNVINAFLSAEDKNFFKHPGVDAKGVIRALINNISNIFEFSVIFYFLIGVIVFIEIESTFLLICAWLYLLFRVIHSIVHISFNNTAARGAIWIFSQTALLLLFLGTAYYVLSS